VDEGNDRLGGIEVQETARVLVVEDEMLFAETLSGLLQDAGFEAAGPAGTIDSAMGVIETSTIDAAILDIRLYDELSYPVAYALRDRGIPFMFLTSYQTRDLPADLRRRPLVEKPFDPSMLVRRLRALLSPAEALTGD
jgi:DNA-binding response OmpR family regulator